MIYYTNVGTHAFKFSQNSSSRFNSVKFRSTHSLFLLHRKCTVCCGEGAELFSKPGERVLFPDNGSLSQNFLESCFSLLCLFLKVTPSQPCTSIQSPSQADNCCNTTQQVASYNVKCNFLYFIFVAVPRLTRNISWSGCSPGYYVFQLKSGQFDQLLHSTQVSMLTGRQEFQQMVSQFKLLWASVL